MGDSIICEGDAGHEMYFIADGEVSVLRAGAEVAQVRCLAIISTTDSTATEWGTYPPTQLSPDRTSSNDSITVVGPTRESITSFNTIITPPALT